MVWAVDTNEDIFKLNGGQWQHIRGKLKGVSVGVSHVWGVNRHDKIFVTETGQGNWQYVAGRLKQVRISQKRTQRTDSRLKNQISVSGFHDRVVWGVNSNEEIWYRNRNYKWQRIPGSLKMVSAGQAGVWGVNRQNQVFYRPGTYGGHWR